MERQIYFALFRTKWNDIWNIRQGGGMVYCEHGLHREEEPWAYSPRGI
jgi:hypothetical protein